MARPKWDPTRVRDMNFWRSATGLLDRVKACYDTLKRINRTAPKELTDPVEILKVFLAIRREALQVEAGALAVPTGPPGRLDSMPAFTSGGPTPEEWLAEQPEYVDFYIEGFRWAALHVGEYRRARKKRESHPDLRQHARVMARAIAEGHDYRTGLPDMRSAEEDGAAAEAARDLFKRAGARYRKGFPRA